MQRNTLYGALVRSVYALDGLDGTFLADLARPVVLRDGLRHLKHTLAVLPRPHLKRLRREVSTAEWHVLKHRRHFAHLVREGRMDDGERTTEEAFMTLEHLRDAAEFSRETLAEALS